MRHCIGLGPSAGFDALGLNPAQLGPTRLFFLFFLFLFLSILSLCFPFSFSFFSFLFSIWSRPNSWPKGWPGPTQPNPTQSSPLSYSFLSIFILQKIAQGNRPQG